MANSMHADLVILGGNVITVNPVKPRAQAIAVKFGRILAVGQDDELRPLIGTDTRVVDARGKTAIPGLNDAHCHVLSAGRSHFLINCGPTVIKSDSGDKESHCREGQDYAQRGVDSWIRI